MICPQCKTPNRDSAKFCDECGWRLAEATDTSIPVVEVDAPSEDHRVATLSELPLTMDEAAAEECVDSWFDNASAEKDDDQADVAEATLAPEQLPEVEPEKPKQAADLSGFVFVGSGADASNSAVDDVVAFNAFETATIPLSSMWGSGNTEAMPKIEGIPSAAPVSVSAPASKKEERERKRAMKKQEREARKQLKEQQNANGGANRKKILFAILAALIIVGLVGGLTYYCEVWGGKTVPDTTGMSEADATYTLQSEGFTVRVSNVKSDDTEGLVLLTDPGSGSRVPHGSEIVIHVSESRVVPSIVGMNIDKASPLLDEQSLKNPVEYKYTRTNSSEEGTVLSVNPEPGTKIKSSAKVTVELATPCRVPDVSGMTSDNAIYTLREAGYFVYVSEVESTELPEGTAYTTSPAKGELLDPDEYVTVYVAVSRGTMRESLASQYLSTVGSVTINGTVCTVDSVVSTTYNASNGSVSFTIMGSPSVFVIIDTYTFPSQLISGTIYFDDNNQVISVG